MVKMEHEDLTFKVVDFKNAKVAIEIQRTIFEEDGMLNILASLDRELFIEKTGINYIDDHVKYYLAYLNNIPVGITGLYYYPGYENEMWLAWFGVLKEYRNLKIGTKILKWSMNYALESGRNILRLYTDIKENATAIILYKKLGFSGVKYDSELLGYDCHIFSKNLQKDSPEPWDGRNLNLAYQSSLEKIDEAKKGEIYSLYEKNYFL